jgi:hypothetical protein
MTITLDLQPDIERGLQAQAQAKGVSLAAYAQEVLAREARAAEPLRHRTGQELIDRCVRQGARLVHRIRNVPPELGAAPA